MALAPGLQRVDDRAQTLADFGQAVVDTRRHFGIDLADNQPVVLERAELLGQHPLRNPRHPPPQLTKTLRTVLQMKEDHPFPLAVDQVEGGFNRAPRPLGKIASFHVGFLDSIQTGTISPKLQYLPRMRQPDK